MIYFILAIVLGFVLRFVATVGVFHYTRICKDESDMKNYLGFHMCIVSYVLGTILKYGGITLTVAFLIKEHILS
jgi:hypothetical protein